MNDEKKLALMPSCERPQRVSGGNYTSNHSTGSFCTHSGPSVFILANFANRP
jgi:hypothetical protein